MRGTPFLSTLPPAARGAARVAAVVLAAVLAFCVSTDTTDAEAEPTVRVAVLKFGTVNWLTETIVAGRLDEAAGYRLEVVPLAGKAATTIAFQSGEVDMIVTDWVWALGERGEARDLRFAPYSRSLGALMARPEAGIGDICDLEGRSVGVVGGELDKSWLVFEALAKERCGIELSTATQAIFGAPPLMSRQLETGAVDAVSTYWHFASRLEAAGMTRVLDVAEAMEEIGIAPAPPLVGFLWDAGATEPEAARAFLASVEMAGELLATDDAAWERVAPLMNAASEAEFRQLRDDYRAGIVSGWTAADTAAAGKLYATLGETGGEAFLRGAGAFDPALFEVPEPDAATAAAAGNGG